MLRLPDAKESIVSCWNSMALRISSASLSRSLERICAPRCARASAPIPSSALLTHHRAIVNAFGTSSWTRNEHGGSAAAAGNSASLVVEHASSETPIPGATLSPGDKMVMLYTCKVCEVRSARVISKAAYQEGVVLVRCPGCLKLHLVADHLAYFEDDGVNVEQVLAKRGEAVRSGHISPGSDAHVCEFSPADVAVLSSLTKSVNLRTGEEVPVGGGSEKKQQAAISVSSATMLDHGKSGHGGVR